MSRTKRFLDGIVLGYVSQALLTVVGLWLTPFLLQRIGQHDYGLWLVGTQLLFYLSLLDLGIVALLPRETAFATGRASGIHEATDLPVTIGHTVRLIIWQMPLVAVGAVIAWLIMPTEWRGLRYPIAVVLVVFVLTFPLRIFGAVLSGLQDFAFVGRVGILSFLLSVASTVALVLAGWGLYSLAVGWVVLQVFGAIASWYRLHTHFPSVLPRSLPPIRWHTARKRLGQGGWVSLNQIAQLLLNGTDILIIGKLFGPTAVVPFVITGKLVSVLANQPQLLMATALPALSQMRMGESRERLSEVCIALSQIMLMLSGAIVCVVLAVNQGFVGRWVGTAQFGGLLLSAMIFLNMLLRHWALTVGYALFAFGYERRLSLTGLVDGIVSVGLMFLFVRQYGVLGAPLALIIGVGTVSLPANLHALAGETKLTLRQLLQPLLPWFIRFVVLVIGAAVLARTWIPDTLPLLVLTAAVVGLIYCAVMFPLVLRNPLGQYVRPRISPLGMRMLRVLRLRASV